MERKAIHEQITTLLDKINHLNKSVMDGEKLHPVEIDLFLGYLKELQEAILNLTEFEASGPSKAQRGEVKMKKSEPIVTRNEPLKVEKRMEQPEVSILPEPKQEVKSKIEIFQEERQGVSTEKTVSQVKKNPIAAQKREPTLNDRFKKDSTEIGEKLKKGNKKKLKDSIDLAQRYIYINELFAGNAEQFNKSLQELGQCKSTEDAIRYFQNLESVFPWKEKSKFAKQFKDSVIQSIEI